MSADVEALTALLAEHQYIPTVLRGVSRCACGIQMHGMPHDHRKHTAEVLAAYVATERLRLLDKLMERMSRRSLGDSDHVVREFREEVSRG